MAELALSQSRPWLVHMHAYVECEEECHENGNNNKLQRSDILNIEIIR